MILPLHSLYFTQSLNVTIFGPLKKHIAIKIEPLVNVVSRIQKVKWLTVFIAAHNKALSTQNIVSGFHGIGIYLFDSAKDLDYSICHVNAAAPPFYSLKAILVTFTTPISHFTLSHRLNEVELYSHVK